MNVVAGKRTADAALRLAQGADPPAALRSILRRDRLRVSVALALILAIAWWGVVTGAGTGMPAHLMSGIPGEPWDGEPMAWSAGYATALFFMWWIMMMAMMLPSAAPVLLLAAALNRRSDPARPPYGRTGAFAAGYLVVWAGFSALATGVQWTLVKSAYLSTMMQASHTAVAGALLVAAGAWQFVPLKHACLRHCRSPVALLTQRRRPGNAGALAMGVEHGAYCVGCCWLLMLLLFVGGVMNLAWIAGLALFVLGEKLLPAGHRFGRVAGAVAILWGVLLFAEAL